MLYIPYTDLFQVISLITPQLLYLSKNQCLVGGGQCATMREVRGQPAGTRSLFHYVDSRNQAQGVRLGVRSLYQLSHPASPSTTILER